MLDLLVRDGLVIDGTGNPGFYGAVAVENERVTILRGALDGVQATRVIDARGRVVCPGFIDMHAHSGLVILAEPRHEPKVQQGVTTELIGIDGNSYAPFVSHDDFLRFVQINSGLDGNPRLPGRWSTVEQYLEMFTNRVAVNIVYVVGNSPLRIATVGWDDRRATEKEMANQTSLLRTAMEEGAWGLSTGLDYPPGSYADTAELTDLSRQASRLGGIYHTHVRYSLGDRFLDPFREALDIGRGSGIPIHITHFYHRTTSTGGASRMLALVEDAREEGLDVTFDSYPYNLSSTRLSIMLPQWTHHGGYDRLMAVLRDPGQRDRLRQEMTPRSGTWTDMWLTNFPHRAEHHRFEGRSIAEVAEILGKDPVDAICDLLVAEDLEVSYVAAGGNLATLPKFVAHPLSMVGSDAVLIGDYPSPRTYGCFPIILAEFVREERWLALPDAIRKMTSFPAQRLGLPDRGLLRDGFKPDIVVFDPKAVKAPATRTQPKQFPVGIDYVIVNGQVVVDRGKHTGALAGRALRRGRAST
jgi:N-acyl-D-amino-acid deacylase